MAIFKKTITGTLAHHAGRGGAKLGGMAAGKIAGLAGAGSKDRATARAIGSYVGRKSAVMATRMAAEPVLGGMRTGGRVARTGIYRLHKGEIVVPAKVLRRVVGRRRK